MDFIIVIYKRTVDRLQIRLYQVILLLFICSTSWADNNVVALKIQNTKQQVIFKPILDFKTSDEIKEAIDNGIRIYLIAKAEIYQPNNWWFDKTIKKQKFDLEISYSSLLKLYQIKNKQTEEQRGFNDYENIWQEFNSISLFKFDESTVKNHWIRVRIVLDKGALPTAMQLPVLFNSNWDINTPWYSQEVKSK